MVLKFVMYVFLSFQDHWPALYLPEEYNSVLESWMWLLKFSHSCSKIIFGCWHFKAATKTFFIYFCWRNSPYSVFGHKKRKLGWNLDVEKIVVICQQHGNSHFWTKVNNRRPFSSLTAKLQMFLVDGKTYGSCRIHCRPQTWAKKREALGLRMTWGVLHILRTTPAQPSVTQYLIFMKLKRARLIRTAGKTML